MTLFDAYVVMPDGTVMNYNTGEMIFSTRNSRGQKGLILKDQGGKSHYFLERNLLKMKREFDKQYPPTYSEV
jgi:hypothetical protein